MAIAIGVCVLPILKQAPFSLLGITNSLFNFAIENIENSARKLEKKIRAVTCKTL
jgi:hypothetical protein